MSTNRRHYRVCAYCGKREYGESIGKTMKFAPDGKNFLSETHFMHVRCPAEFCARCSCSLTSTDYEAGRCTQCGSKL
jgi:DNA-directed RNA polymerase subunit RPC12/RpoP